LPTGDKRRVNIFPNGLQEERGIGTNGSRTTTLPDGTVQSLILGPDPRFGMQSPLPTQIQVRTPSGLVSTLTESRTVTLSDPLDPLALLTQTDILTLNNRTYTLMRPFFVKRQTAPESGFSNFFPPCQCRRRQQSVQCLDLISVFGCQPRWLHHT